ncbi:PQQ-binding-like beta-propeller repeat protein [Streptomyces sp. NPDC091266]|uniref:protein kinase domain-containing protein n=1 Tax=Streptomyces sp. NPDC091266 TaxID=3365978 RepID=UPI003826F3B6
MPPLRNSGVDPEAERPEYAGKYRLEARLGAGGMGVVHLARSSSGLLLAVKVIHAEFAQDPEFRGRFRQEVAAARRVSGAFTAPVVDADPDAVRPWMATLHIPGPTLSDHVKRKGPLAPAEVRRLASGLAEALRDIHRAGVVHRDLKPGNVLLAADGPKVIDFGISRPSDSEMRTETGKLIGTPPFMAPEQFQRPREVGPAADIFALGSVLVHAATGSGPFDSDSPYVVAYQVVHDEADLAGVPEELAPLIERCLAKDPADRPTPDALMEQLHTDLPTEVHDATDALYGDAPNALAPDAPLPDSRIPDARIPSQRQPGQRPPLRAESAPPRAEATHIRAVPPADRPPEADPSGGRPGTQGPGAISATAGTARPEHRPRRPRRRRLALWAAVALVVTGAGTLVGVRALSSPAPDEDPALQTRPSRPADDAFHPWRTTLVERPAGYRAEMPFCTTGPSGEAGKPSTTTTTGAPTRAVFCVQSGLRAARVDPDTGRVAWRRKAGPATKSDAPPTTPVLSGGLLYVSSPDSKRLEALDPSADGKGATRWTKDISAYEGGTTIVGDRILLATGDGTVTALDSRTHQQRWHKRFPGHRLASFSSPGNASPGGDGTAYAAETAADGSGTQVTAIDPKDGRIRWARRLPGNLTATGTSPSGALYLTATDPTYTSSTTAVVRYDPATKRTRRFPLAAPLDSAAAVVRGETVYLLAEGGALQAVGDRTWDVETSVSRGSAPVVDGDRLYFTAADGRLLAVDTRSGAQLGQTRLRLAADRHNGFLETLPAPLVDARHGRIYAAAPDGTVFAAPTKDPAGW